jgi:hypothetical protein
MVGKASIYFIIWHILDFSNHLFIYFLWFIYLFSILAFVTNSNLCHSWLSHNFYSSPLKIVNIVVVLGNRWLSIFIFLSRKEIFQDDTTISFMPLIILISLNLVSSWDDMIAKELNFPHTCQLIKDFSKFFLC